MRRRQTNGRQATVTQDETTMKSWYSISVNEHSSASNYLSDEGNHTRASRTNNDTNNNDNNTRGTTNRKTTARGFGRKKLSTFVQEIEQLSLAQRQPDDTIQQYDNKLTTNFNWSSYN
eukprot:Pgem_evm2s2159